MCSFTEIAVKRDAVSAIAGKHKAGRLWAWVCALAAVFVCVLLLNVFSIPAQDELCYAFMGQYTPDNGPCPRIASLMDIVRQQYSDYLLANGRIFVHGMVALFAYFQMYYLFDIVNSCMWFVFVFLVLKESRVDMNLPRFVCGSLLVFAFWWYSENVSINASFGVNYLWMACATLATMRLWRKLNSWWWMPVGFVYGWGQEAFSLPMVAALAGSVAIRSISERRYAATAKQTAFMVFMAIGAFGLVMSPGIRARAENSLDFSLLNFSIAIAKWFAGLALAIWPMFLLLCAIWLLWNARKKLRDSLYADLEWWLFCVASIGLCVITCSSGLYRICSGWMMAVIVLCLRRLGSSFLDSRGVRVFSCAAFCWLVAGTALQISYGLANFNMLKTYRADEQGVTYRDVFPPTFWYNMCSANRFTSWSLMLFRRDCGKEFAPIILSRRLYEDLYLNPDAFFSFSTSVGECYYNPAFPDILVKKGKAAFLDGELKILRDANTPKGWRRFLPGRLRFMFPSDGTYMHFPNEGKPVSIKAKDGNWYSVVHEI